MGASARFAFVGSFSILHDRLFRVCLQLVTHLRTCFLPPHYISDLFSGRGLEKQVDRCLLLHLGSSWISNAHNAHFLTLETAQPTSEKEHIPIKTWWSEKHLSPYMEALAGPLIHFERTLLFSDYWWAVFQSLEFLILKNQEVAICAAPIAFHTIPYLVKSTIYTYR